MANRDSLASRFVLGGSICCCRPPIRAKDMSMKPEHETRRKIIREWMSLPKDKRQTEEQAKPFAKMAMERLPSSGDPYRQIMRTSQLRDWVQKLPTIRNTLFLAKAR